MSDMDIVYKFRTPLESRLLAKQLYGAVNEGLVEKPVMMSSNANSITLNNLSFYLMGRPVKGVKGDIDFERRVFHVSYAKPNGFTFNSLPADAIGIGFRYTYTGYDTPHVPVNEALFDIVTLRMLDWCEDHYVGHSFSDGCTHGIYEGLMLCHLWRDTSGSAPVWRMTPNYSDWTDTLHHINGVHSGLRVDLMTIGKDYWDGDVASLRFLVKRFNHVVRSVNILGYNKTSNTLSNITLDTSDGVMLPNQEVGKFYAIGFLPNFVSGGTTKLVLLSDVGRDDINGAMADAVKVGADGDFVVYNLVAVVKWDYLRSEVFNFPNWEIANSNVVFSSSAFNITSSGAVELRDLSVSTGKIANNAVTTAKILDGNVTRDKIPDSAINAAKLDSNAVTTVKIGNNQVTTEKIADLQITAAKLANTLDLRTKTVTVATPNF